MNSIQEKFSAFHDVSSGHCDTMYGMLLESIQFFIQQDYDKDVWLHVMQHMGMKNTIFNTHKQYNNQIMTDLAHSCCCIIGDQSQNGYMKYFGKCFVNFCRHYGYDKLLQISGRHFRDFLNGIDNIHEMIRFSYPHLQSPSFYLESEDAFGCVLVYRSKRVGFQYYVMGQMQECARVFYGIEVHMRILHEDVLTKGGCSITYRLDFHNKGYVEQHKISPLSSLKTFGDVAGATFMKVIQEGYF